MRLLAIVAALAGLVAALPEPVAVPPFKAELPEHAALDKRGCNVNCVTSCCKQVGCNGSLHCGASYCKTTDAGHSWCECVCRYN
ncbi:hypothetical protein QBC34DRAFT_436933 [Podospora aff. communis PSN243]|uniref:Invertebrate defensins family profile domain-containing protein n=1 Tax=Podospora aff. communis PSN243 TaxID=3040156 RepID=A0AAV9GU54_9PEZI|nr:hypothetical protein QBC34DRAFT_436933 [Podospora aff. communis PSN243]